MLVKDNSSNESPFISNVDKILTCLKFRLIKFKLSIHEVKFGQLHYTVT